MSAAAATPLRLHGYAVSNYFNIAYAALIEKAAHFEIVVARASKDPGFLLTSPMGKIPVLETSEGWIAETVAILEYLEDMQPEPPLYPPDAFRRARARQIINVIQMYVEAPVRTLFPGVFMGQSNSETTTAAARAILDRATQALNILMRPAPYFLGDAVSHADLFAFYCLDIADRVTRFVYARSIITEIGTLGDWSAKMARRKSSRTVFANFYPIFTSYLSGHNAKYESREDDGNVLVPQASLSARAGVATAAEG